MGDRDLRVSDVEREHVGRLLQRAVGLGMLSLGEFTERMDTALAAKTRGELNTVLVDLPGIRLVGQPTQAPAPAPGFHQGPRYLHQPHRYAAAQRMPQAVPGNVIRARLSSVERKGAWQVPPTLMINSLLGSVRLDFTQAVMSTQVVEIHVNDTCGSLELIVPPEATVDMNAIDLVASSAETKVRTGPPIGPLHIIVHGTLRFSSVKAKHPFGTNWKRFLNGA
ncbi:DUF1707 SHOCT-like domain-containing protein [Nocardia sp. CDC160]|uniref:DUF1707 SHOCT-like domain-containing protein n=1 Tax=Nocardia sp. CDC160 TaxID=3112166 RepID=UPI002DBD6997|nr:DUF1707 domain-containing protein [Nocardia sp. CDC160]MEC3914354.1 DUF1707 domain-containing protein [Nocardia sp. CDC160]